MQQPHTRLCFLLGTLWSHSSCYKGTLVLLFLVKERGKESKYLLTTMVVLHILVLYSTASTEEVNHNHSSAVIAVEGPIWLSWLLLGRSSTSRCTEPSRSKQKVLHAAIGARQSWLLLTSGPSSVINREKLGKSLMQVSGSGACAKAISALLTNALLSLGNLVILEMHPCIPPNSSCCSKRM